VPAGEVSLNLIKRDGSCQLGERFDQKLKFDQKLPVG